MKNKKIKIKNAEMSRKSLGAMGILVLSVVIMWLLAPSVIFSAGNPEAETINKAIDKIDKLFPGEMVKSDDLAANFGEIVSIFLGIIGTVALIIFIWGGIIWMTSMGEMKKVSNAKDTMIWAALGLFVIFISFIIVRFLISGSDFWK